VHCSDWLKAKVVLMMDPGGIIVNHLLDTTIASYVQNYDHMRVLEKINIQK
jgi:hypothetical protein